MAAAMRDRWTDERLDDLKGSVDDGFKRMDDRFARVDQQFDRIDQRFDRIDQKFDRIDARIDSMARAVIYGSFTLSAAMVAGFIAVLTRI